MNVNFNNRPYGRQQQYCPPQQASYNGNGPEASYDSAPAYEEPQRSYPQEQQDCSYPTRYSRPQEQAPAYDQRGQEYCEPQRPSYTPAYSKRDMQNCEPQGNYGQGQDRNYDKPRGRNARNTVINNIYTYAPTEVSNGAGYPQSSQGQGGDSYNAKMMNWGQQNCQPQCPPQQMYPQQQQVAYPQQAAPQQQVAFPQQAAPQQQGNPFGNAGQFMPAQAQTVPVQQQSSAQSGQSTEMINQILGKMGEFMQILSDKVNTLQAPQAAGDVSASAAAEPAASTDTTDTKDVSGNDGTTVASSASAKETPSNKAYLAVLADIKKELGSKKLTKEQFEKDVLPELSKKYAKDADNKEALGDIQGKFDTIANLASTEKVNGKAALQTDDVAALMVKLDTKDAKGKTKEAEPFKDALGDASGRDAEITTLKALQGLLKSNENLGMFTYDAKSGVLKKAGKQVYKASNDSVKKVLEDYFSDKTAGKNNDNKDFLGLLDGQPGDLTKAGFTVLLDLVEKNHFTLAQLAAKGKANKTALKNLVPGLKAQTSAA